MYVRSGATATTNFGADPVLLTKLSGGGTSTRETYLKFDLRNIPSVGTARLRLYGSVDDTESANVTVAAFPVANASWSESTITWNTRPGGSIWPNEPAGFVTLTDQPWNAIVGGGWNRRPGGTDSSSRCERADVADERTDLYPIGLVDGVAPATQYYPVSTKEIFIGLWWKPSNPWQGDISNVNKIQFLQVQNSSVYMAMYRSEGRARTSWMCSGPNRAPAWLTPNVNSGVVTLGQWHRLECT